MSATRFRLQKVRRRPNVVYLDRPGRRDNILPSLRMHDRDLKILVR
jgi:hypothetical protein